MKMDGQCKNANTFTDENNKIYMYQEWKLVISSFTCYDFIPGQPHGLNKV